MDIYDKIILCLQQSIDRPSIHKFFRFSAEDLQDNPDRLREIADYLSKHEGKYEDFSIDIWIDEETFRPMIMLKLTPTREYSQHMQPGIKGKILDYFTNTQQNQEKK